MPRDRTHLLTVGMEDYFQVGAFHGLIERGQWYRFESRFERNAQRAFELLESHEIRATFFVSGWIAEHYPEIVRAAVDRGHEVASKGYYHRSIREMAPEEFREDLARSREAVERASGRKVKGFRVSHGGFSRRDLWALDILAKDGYAYDSSIFPKLRRFAREPWRRFAHTHEFQGKTLWEFPISSARILGLDIPIGGGNYFRQFPAGIVRRAVSRWDRRVEQPFVMYFHLWELDPDQPRFDTVPWHTRIRHYRNLDRMSVVLESYFETYRFASIAGYLGLESEPADPAPSPHSRPVEIETRPQPLADRLPVSIVIPCFNEEMVLPYLANTLKSVASRFAASYDLRFLFVDDGSSDRTWNSLEATFGSWPEATLIRLPKNRGVAAAILEGIRAAETEIVCSIDCDCTYNPHELAAMIPKLADGVDLVTASPYHPQGEVRNLQAWRLALSRSASMMYRCVLRQKLWTYTSCFRVYRRESVLGLRIQNGGFLGVTEILGELDLNGRKVVEHPTILQVRMLGRSKMKTVRTIVGHLRLLSGFAVRRLRSRLGRSISPSTVSSLSAPLEGSARPQLERTPIR